MVKSNVSINRFIIAILVVFLLVSNMLLFMKTIKNQMLLEDILEKCNNSLIYVFNRFHKDIFLTSSENLSNNEYIFNVFTKTADNLYLWKDTMKMLERANPKFNFGANYLYFYISALSHQEKISQEHLDRLNKINSLVKQLSTSNTASLYDKLEFSPKESIEKTLKEIGEISKQGLETIYK